MDTGAAVEERPRELASSGAEDTYRPHLDGLRALAVYLVVLFHAGSTQFVGGFVGVDVFFVLSGFLVTQLLLRDVSRRGRIRFSRFYSRRFRRLLPAAFVALIVTAIVYTAIATPVEVASAVGSFKAAFLYSTNWYFIHQSRAYFATGTSTNPVLHFWSLAVEEQFYLVWPLLLGAVFALTGRLDRDRQLRTIRIAVGVGAVASAVWALSLRLSDLNRAYYGTDARAYELLAGALIALTPALLVAGARYRRSMRVATVLSLAGLLAVATSLIDVDAITRGVAVTVTTCVLIVAIEAADGGLVKRVLSSSPFVYLGKISYGTYLWHWLVILVILKAFNVSTIATIGVACLIATGLAALSAQLLEMPVRTSPWLDRYRRTVIAGGLAVTVVAALVLIPTVVDPAHASKPVLRNSSASNLTPLPKNLNLRAAGSHADQLDCVGLPVGRCLAVRGSGIRVLLLGDSQAEMFLPMVNALARRDGLQMYASTQSACPWQRELYTSFKFDSCKKLKDDEYQRLLGAIDPQLVIVAGLDFGHVPADPARFEGPNGQIADATAIAKTTSASVAALGAGGRTVLIIEPIPVPAAPNVDPLSCLSKATVLESCRYRAITTLSPLEREFRQLAARDPKVLSLSLDRQVCPLAPICDPIVGGVIVKRNAAHLTVAFATSLVPYVEQYLKSVGVIPVKTP